MNKLKLAAALCLGSGLLVGCSSKPDVSDVKDGIVDTWKTCSIVKPYDFKKINGVDHGDSYEMAISYKIEVVSDIPKGGVYAPIYPQGVGPTDPEYVKLNSMPYPSPAAAPEQNASSEQQLEYAKIQQESAERDALSKRVEARKAPYDAAHLQLVDFYNKNCAADILPVLFKVAAKSKEGGPESLAKGDVFDMSLVTSMVKSENGWIRK